MKKSDTRCIHPIPRDEASNGAVTAPVQLSAAYNYLDAAELRYPGFSTTYNQQRVGQIMAQLEQGQWGMPFSSGMAAISTAILSFAGQHDHIIFSRDLYGGTYKFAEEELPKRGISCSYADHTPGSYQALLQPNTRIIYIETPANPLLSIVSLKEVAALAKAHGIITIIDNTFASPINQQPILHGIDIAVHSGTKYLGGHNDLPFGVLISNNEAHKIPIQATAKIYGGSLSPYECYLVERSLKTLALRVLRQNENAFTLAKHLTAHPRILQVYYPGLPSHPGYATACEQMTGFGGMLSFELDIPAEKIISFLRALKIISPALSLGGVESLICAPAETSHRGLTHEKRLALGIKDNLLRLSAGIENVEDLMEDIDAAIAEVIR
jgi:cystathionine beta-lyase/cystathionine gamma-synthase